MGGGWTGPCAVDWLVGWSYTTNLRELVRATSLLYAPKIRSIFVRYFLTCGHMRHTSGATSFSPLVHRLEDSPNVFPIHSLEAHVSLDDQCHAHAANLDDAFNAAPTKTTIVPEQLARPHDTHQLSKVGLATHSKSTKNTMPSLIICASLGLRGIDLAPRGKRVKSVAHQVTHLRVRKSSSSHNSTTPHRARCKEMLRRSKNDDEQD